MRFIFVLVALSASLFSASSMAAVVLNINDPIVNQHTIVLDPVTFTVTSDGYAGGIVFEDFFLFNNSSYGTHVSTAMTAQIDGGDTFAIGGVTTNGVYNRTSSILDPNDLWFNIATNDEFFVNVGQTVTIWGETTFGHSNLAPINTAFNQTAVLWDEGSIALSGVTQLTAVPIPAAVWLFGSALAGLGWMRRKQTV